MIEARVDVFDFSNKDRITLSGHPHHVLMDISTIIRATYQILEKKDIVSAEALKRLIMEFHPASPLWDLPCDYIGIFAPDKPEKAGPT